MYPAHQRFCDLFQVPQRQVGSEFNVAAEQAVYSECVLVVTAKVAVAALVVVHPIPNGTGAAEPEILFLSQWARSADLELLLQGDDPAHQADEQPPANVDVLRTRVQRGGSRKALVLEVPL